MKKYHILPLLFFTLIVSNLNAQEICGNGIDDDNNGLIDCFDPACSSSTDCDGFFYGAADPACQFVPTAGTFELEELWNTRVANGGTDGTNNLPGTVPIDQRATVMVGDMDGDGIPEVVAKHDAKDVPTNASNPRTSFVPELYIFNGVDGTIKAKATISANDKFSSLAIGDIDKTDGYTDIFFFNDSGELERYVYDGTNLIPAPGFTVTGGGHKLYTPNLADFDHDGNVEVYAGNVIFSAHTGDLLANGTNGSGAGSKGEHSTSVNEPFSVAFDIDASASNLVTTNLELIAGNKVYDIDFTQPFNSRMTERTSAPAGYDDGVTAVADIDNDGDVDGVVVSDGDVYVWDLQTSTSLSQRYAISGSTNTGGRPNVANFDGDPEIEIGVAGFSIYLVLNYNTTTDMLELVWSTTTDDTSERTSSTVFDFEGDGINEIIYSDEGFLYIYDGQGNASSAKILAQIASQSGTRFDNPLIVDVNGDGQSEVIITAQDNNGPLDSENGYIRCLRSKNKPWVPSRKVWNQHNYMIVNVNDDLSIPLVQQNTTILGSNSEPKEVINNFLNQASIYTITGNHVFAAPNMQVEFAGSTTFCQDASNNITLEFKITNTGDATLPAGVPISVFSSDPYENTVGDADLIETFNTPTAVTANGTPLNFSETISPSGTVSTIYILMNHSHDGAKASKGTSYQLSKTPNREVVSGIGECNFDDNFFTFTAVGSTPNIGLTVETPRTSICSGESTVIQVLNSESGINYQLRDASNNNVGSSVAGNGGTIELSINNLTADATFTVYATPAGTSCSLPLTDTQAITIQSAPNLALILETTTNNLCTGTDASITIKSAENAISYQATIDGNTVGNASTGTGADLILTIPSSSLSEGANNVVVTATNPSVCTLNLTNTLTINVGNPPSNDRQFETKICVESGQPASITIDSSEVGVSYQLVNDADGSSVGAAVAGTGETITLSSDPLTNPATFSVSATGTGACNQSITFAAKVEASINEITLTVPEVDTIFGGEETSVVANSEATEFSWSTRVERTDLPDDESIISGNNTNNINVAPKEDTWYIVTASDDKGCSRTDSVLVAVKFEIFIPSLFSPNSDGNNDAFTVKTESSSIQELDFRVFDRAGNLVYETQDAVEATTTGWDGKNNGREQPISNYIWVIDGTFVNGQPIEYQGKNRGEINLIR